MTTRDTLLVPLRRRALLVALAIPLLLVTHVGVAATTVPAQRFASPEEAVAALVAAARSGDAAALVRVLGSAAEPLLHSGDAVADQDARERFLKQYDEGHALHAVDDKRTELEVGADHWPLPIPLVKDDQGWAFDAAAGADEVLARRIGNNERSAIQVCLAYVDAQREYRARNPEKDKLPHYAQRFISTKGKKDGLYWPAKEGEDESPVGEGFARARAEGYTPGEHEGHAPFHGYLYRILTAQGASADGGAYDYLAKGKLIGGFALIAYPARYGVSGVMTFIVNHDGVVYQRDLGSKTASVASAITVFDPDGHWTRVSEEDEDEGETAAAKP